MNWSRALAVGAAGLVLCGCAGADGTAPHAAPSSARPSSASPSAGPSLTLNGQSDARPGGRVHMMLYGVTRARGGDEVTARSAAFTGPVRLRWETDHYWALGTLSMTGKPGSYPLTVAVHGRDVAHDSIRVVPSPRPSFTLSPSQEVTRPGEPVEMAFDDLYPGEKGTGFTVRSPALPAPVRLVHDDLMDLYNPRAFSAQPELRTGLADGTYTFALYGADGRRVAERRLTVRASRPGDPDYLGKPYGPDFVDPEGTYFRGDAPFRPVPGGRVSVMWHDLHPDPGEETRLTATSPAFTGVVRLRHDDTKSADGDDPRFVGTATVRPGLRPGRYPVTVVSHHGRTQRTGYLTVTAR
ncbi:hypothetical protein [Streptomyces sp. 4F14]|uniref:hypothetical protein n=1 Tax=Streptomyces sp. 4F14 TaxID=3394380 RepID=UPI003A86BD77